MDGTDIRPLCCGRAAHDGAVGNDHGATSLIDRHTMRTAVAFAFGCTAEDGVGDRGIGSGMERTAVAHSGVALEGGAGDGCFTRRDINRTAGHSTVVRESVVCQHIRSGGIGEVNRAAVSGGSVFREGIATDRNGAGGGTGIDRAALRAGTVVRECGVGDIDGAAISAVVIGIDGTAADRSFFGHLITGEFTIRDGERTLLICRKINRTAAHICAGAGVDIIRKYAVLNCVSTIAQFQNGAPNIVAHIIAECAVINREGSIGICLKRAAARSICIAVKGRSGDRHCSGAAGNGNSGHCVAGEGAVRNRKTFCVSCVNHGELTGLFSSAGDMIQEAGTGDREICGERANSRAAAISPCRLDIHCITDKGAVFNGQFRVVCKDGTAAERDGKSCILIGLVIIVLKGRVSHREGRYRKDGTTTAVLLGTAGEGAQIAILVTVAEDEAVNGGRRVCCDFHDTDTIFTKSRLFGRGIDCHGIAAVENDLRAGGVADGDGIRDQQGGGEIDHIFRGGIREHRAVKGDGLGAFGLIGVSNRFAETGQTVKGIEDILIGVHGQAGRFRRESVRTRSKDADFRSIQTGNRVAFGICVQGGTEDHGICHIQTIVGNGGIVGIAGIRSVQHPLAGGGVKIVEVFGNNTGMGVGSCNNRSSQGTGGCSLSASGHCQFINARIGSGEGICAEYILIRSTGNGGTFGENGIRC